MVENAVAGVDEAMSWEGALERERERATERSKQTPEMKLFTHCHSTMYRFDPGI